MRLLQPVFDPDPKPTSVSGLPGEITSNNTSQGNSAPIVYRLSFPIIKKPRSAELLKTCFGIENSHSYVESESCISLRIVNHVTNSNGIDNCSKFVFRTESDSSPS